MEEGKLIFFSGTGGTGKTVLAEEVHKQFGLFRYPSPTREFYALKNVSSEKELMTRDVEYRQYFQQDLYEWFLKRITKYCAASVVSTVFERSPFCNLSYLTFHNPDGSLQRVEENFERAIKFFDFCLQGGWQVIVVAFPYPTQWIREGKSRDSFRAIAGGKDMIVHALMNNYIKMAADLLPDIEFVHLKEATTQVWCEQIGEVLASNKRRLHGI